LLLAGAAARPRRGRLSAAPRPRWPRGPGRVDDGVQGELQCRLRDGMPARTALGQHMPSRSPAARQL